MRALALALLGACATGHPDGRAVDAGSVDGAATRASPPVVAPREAPAKPVAEAASLRVQSVTGAVTGAREGEMIGADRALTVEQGGRVVLALADFVVLQVLGPARATVAPDGAPALLVREGALAVDVAPHGVRAGERTFWIGTPAARLEIPEAARFALRVHTDGAGTLSLVSGQLQLQQGGGELALTGDVSRCLTPAGISPHGPLVGKLEARTQALARARSCAPRGTALTAEETEAALERRLALVEQSEARARALLAEHARLVAANDPGAASVARTLAGEAASTLRLRAEARTARTLVEARLVGRRPDARAHAFHERAARLAPYR